MTSQQCGRCCLYDIENKYDFAKARSDKCDVSSRYMYDFAVIYIALSDIPSRYESESFIQSYWTLDVSTTSQWYSCFRNCRYGIAELYILVYEQIYNILQV